MYAFYHASHVLFDTGRLFELRCVECIQSGPLSSAVYTSLAANLLNEISEGPLLCDVPFTIAMVWRVLLFTHTHSLSVSDRECSELLLQDIPWLSSASAHRDSRRVENHLREPQLTGLLATLELAGMETSSGMP